MYKIKVSRFHYRDLEAAALNAPNTTSAKEFEKMKITPGFEIVEAPKPGELLQDLSVMFMYSQEIQVLKLNQANEKSI